MNPEQAQVFTPTPGTYSAVMYYTELDPFTKRRENFCWKRPKKKRATKEIIVKNIFGGKKKWGSTSGMQEVLHWH